MGTIQWVVVIMYVKGSWIPSWVSGMTSHRVKVTSLDDIDAELTGWLRTAYDAA